MVDLDRRRRSVVALRVAVAVTLGAIGAALGCAVGWRGAGELPSNEQAASIVGVALPGHTVREIERREELFAYEHLDETRAQPVFTALVGSDNYLAGYVGLTNTGPERATVTVGAVSAHLRAAGWRVELAGEQLNAYRDALVLHLSDLSQPYDEPLRGSTPLRNTYLEAERAPRPRCSPRH
jgi:hypothetical protein